QPSGSYGYEVKACNAVGCGPWSAQGSTTVSVPTAPTSAPTLTVPANSATGSYAVSWTGVSGAASYNLQQRINSDSWTTVASPTGTSWAASGKATGNYGYRVQSCNAGGCSAWSATATTVVTIPVPIAINGQSYQGSDIAGGNGGSSAEVGFEIVGSNTWEVFTAVTSSGPTVAASGAVPSGATTVQYTWTE